MNILDEQIEGIVRFYVSWVFLQFAHIPIFGRGATCPPYDLKSQKGQIEGIIRFYAASATCQGDKLKWTPTCQGTNCGARMFPGFLLNLSLFLSSAGGQLRASQWPLALSVALAATAPPKGEPSLASPLWGEVSCLWHDGEGNLPTARTCVSGSHRRGVQPPVSPAGSVGSGRSPLGTRTPRREETAQALGRFARPPARTCAILSHRRGVQAAAPLARIVPCGHATAN